MDLSKVARQASPSPRQVVIGLFYIEDGYPMKDDIITVRPTVTTTTVQRLPNYVGISEQTAGSTGLSMNLVVIPAGAKADPPVHLGYETAIYLLKGRVETRYGDKLAKTVVNEAGDFIFIPAGVPHQPINLSETEAALAIVARHDANEQEHVQPYRPLTP